MNLEVNEMRNNTMEKWGLTKKGMRNRIPSIDK